MMNIVFIGAGNLATNLAKEFHQKSFNIQQVYSRTLASATSLAQQVDASATNSLQDIVTDADIYIFSVKDSALDYLLNQIPANDGLWIHTAGSITIDVFREKNKRFGVLYPFQTFSKKREVNFVDIPIFVEANNEDDEALLLDLSRKISDKVYKLSSEKRQYIHLTGVFACNFVNHMYTISSKILDNEDIPYEIMLPLVDETVAKIHELKPIEAQTGPAVRYDQNVMSKHIDLLKDKDLKDIYQLISKHIYKINKA